jgi:hypothetical protein
MEVMRWREVAFHCPQGCGGRVSEEIRFFVTDTAEVVVCGTCGGCGTPGMTSVAIAELLTHIPTGMIN